MSTASSPSTVITSIHTYIRPHTCPRNLYFLLFITPMNPPALNTGKAGSPYLQHRVARLLVQHGRRHQNHLTRNPFLKSCSFRLCLVQAAVVNLFVLNLVCFISVCHCIPETGRLENTYSCCGFWLWSWVAAVVNLFVLNLLCFISVCL